MTHLEKEFYGLHSMYTLCNLLVQNVDPVEVLNTVIDDYRDEEELNMALCRLAEQNDVVPLTRSQLQNIVNIMGFALNIGTYADFVMFANDFVKEEDIKLLTIEFYNLVRYNYRKDGPTFDTFIHCYGRNIEKILNDAKTVSNAVCGKFEPLIAYRVVKVEMNN